MRTSISKIKSPITQSLYSRLVILISAIFLSGCSNERLPIYNEGEVQIFNVTLADKSVECNYLELHSMPGKFFLLQDNIIWKAEFSFADGSKVESESHTGLLNLTSRVWLHPPRIGPLEILEAFPFPDIRFPIEVRNEWKNSLKVVSGFDELNGKTIKAEYKLNSIKPGTILSDTLWEIHSVSSFEGSKSKYYAKYLFSKNLGFVNYRYEIDTAFFAEITLMKP
jgi:hypothetical protein